MNDLANVRFERPVAVENELCSRYRCTKSACSACADVCPVPGAVRFLDQGVEIADACVACGACASACPNGALRPIEGDAELASRIRSRVRPGTAFRIACGRASGRVDLVLPCLSRLTEALVLEPVRGGAERVVLLDPGCSGCGLGKAAPQWQRVLAFSQALCESAGLGADRIARVDAPAGKPVEAQDSSEGVSSRRALFRAMVEKWTTSGTPEKAEEPETGKTPPETFREAVQQRRENRKRSELLQVLDALPAAKPAPRAVAAAGVPLANLEISRQCVGCNVCETLCPTGALRHREGDGAYALDFEPALCTGCRICEVACFHQAIRIGDAVDVSVLYARPKVTLVTAPRRTCPACSETFLGESSGLCPLCQVSDRRRAQVARRMILGGTQA